LKIGYDGVISIENHTLDHDPTEELEQAREWLESLIKSNTPLN